MKSWHAPPAAAERIRGAPAPSPRRWVELVLGIYFVRAFAAFALASPLVGMVDERLFGFPSGEEALFEPGGLLLVDTLHASFRAWSGALRGGTFGFVLLNLLWLLPLAAAISAINEQESTFAELSYRAAGVFGRYALLLGVWLLGFGFVAMGFALASAPLDWSSGAGILKAAVLALVAGSLAALLGILHDLSRVAIVRNDLGVLDSIEFAAFAFLQRPFQTILSWAWRVLFGLALVLLALAAQRSGALGQGRRLVLLALMHQAVIVGLTWLRLSWLAYGSRLVAAASPPGETWE